MRVLRWLIVLAALGAVAGWFLTGPDPLDPDVAEGLTGDAEAGKAVFIASGCASCHSAPETVPDPDFPILAGGRAFASDFGTFYAPNISSDISVGVGAWTDADLLNAIMRGVSPSGAHLYPAFPYDAYAKATPQDMVDLVAYLRTLPGDPTQSVPHDVGFPFSIRRAVGGWKLLFRSDDWVLADAATPQIERGRYLVEALGHCGECHTPRNALGGLDHSRWMAGAPTPDGQGRVPNITPAKLGWSAGEIYTYLTTGFTPEYDSVGGHMAHVVENMSKLPETDVRAVVAYLQALPPDE